jgi:hypothetical protein
MGYKNIPVTLRGTVLSQTAKAIRFLHEDETTPGNAVWLPRSQIQVDSWDEDTNEVELQLDEWLAIEKGLV